jgi:transcriptional regulator with XRE-family HTH domain
VVVANRNGSDYTGHTYKERERMRFREALGEVIREQRHAQGKPMRAITEKSYVSLGHLSEVERGHKELSSDLLEAVATALGMPTYELVLEAGFRMYRESSSEFAFAPELESWIQNQDYAKL